MIYVDIENTFFHTFVICGLSKIDNRSRLNGPNLEYTTHNWPTKDQNKNDGQIDGRWFFQTKRG
jgi:hypothetical protein